VYRKAILLLGCLACAAAGGSLAALAQARPRAKAPRITARPDNLMVRGHTTLKGSRFPPNAAIELRECGRTFWIVPEEPCNSANTIFVRTDAHGRFVTSFLVELCPEGMPGKVVTERTCYIGEPQPAEDSVTLLGATRITVTYP
jgi:hypothetical protein